MKEKLGSIGRIGCLLSVVGAFIIVLHAPEDKDVSSIDELLFYALQPGRQICYTYSDLLEGLKLVLYRICYILYRGVECQLIYGI